MITTLQMYQPILSHDIIEYIGNEKAKSMKKNIIYFSSIFGVAIISTIAQVHLWYRFSFMGYSISNTLSLIIYKKAMKHPLITEK
jgi:hypothetical protein